MDEMIETIIRILSKKEEQQKGGSAGIRWAVRLPDDIRPVVCTGTLK